MSYQFCRTKDSKKIHIREGISGRPFCNGGYSYYGAKSVYHAVLIENEKYPRSLRDVCATCKSNKKANAFLIGVEMKTAPEAVTSCIFVDINLPTKTMVTLSEASRIIKKVSTEVERFTAIDIEGVCVKFNLKEY